MFRLKAADIDNSRPEDMMMKLNEDVAFALEEYNDALKQENQAKNCWRKRELLESNLPQNPTPEETLLMEESVDFFRSRFKDRMRYRIKKKETYDKRRVAKDKHKQDADEVDRKENWVYREGQNFNIRWSALPRWISF